MTARPLLPLHDRRILTVDEAASAIEPGGRRLRIALLADDRHAADVVLDHIRSIKRHSRHHIIVINPIHSHGDWVLRALNVDAILIHYSICILYDYFLPPPIVAAVKAFPGPKVQIIQDEFRWINRMTRRMAELGIRAVFSSLTPDNIERVYHHEHLAGVRFVSGLPGYVSERLRRLPIVPLVDRPHHLVYRGRPLPIFLGTFAQEKVGIGLQALKMAETYDLKIDCKLSEEDRVYGRHWNDLLMKGRAALATEGGATVFDFDETIERDVESFQRDNPAANTGDIWENVVKPLDGRIVHKTITPRVLEAVMCRTALVMYPGEYRGILQPWEHYLPLERDGSNEAEVARRLKDDDALRAMIDRAYHRIADDPALQFKRYVTAIDSVLDTLVAEADIASAASSRGALPLAGTVPVAAAAATWMLVVEGRLAALRDHTDRLQRRAEVFLKLHVLGRSSVPNTTTDGRLNILLLCEVQRRNAPTVADHVFALRDHSRHNITVFSWRRWLPRGLDLSRFDALIVHYSLVACLDSYIGHEMRNAIRSFRGFKAAFVQDDYRFVNDTIAALTDMKINALFGLAPEPVIDQIYPPDKLPGVVRETVLAGYVPTELCDRSVPSYEARPIDVGYRARKVPAWLGALSQEKWLIADRFGKDAAAYGLKCDISTRERDRIYGEAWISFVSSCKAMLGTESGASVIDFTGEIQKNVEAHLLREPDASFEALRDLNFRDIDGKVVLQVISPRCFEAAALRTLMILYEGSYSGRLQPWRHYVPLKKDHSNMDEVVAVLRDPAKATAIIERAYAEVALNPDNSFEAMVRQFDRVIDEHFRPEMRAAAPPYSDSQIEAFRMRMYAGSALRTIRAKLRNRIAVGLNLVARTVKAGLDLLPPSISVKLRGPLRTAWRAFLGMWF